MSHLLVIKDTCASFLCQTASQFDIRSLRKFPLQPTNATSCAIQLLVSNFDAISCRFFYKLVPNRAVFYSVQKTCTRKVIAEESMSDG